MANNIPVEGMPREKIERYGKVSRVLWIVLVFNIIVAIAKVVLGYFTRCLSILADGIHSLSDGASNIVGLIGIHLARQPKDFDHPYGHRRYETLASLGIAFLLLFLFFQLMQQALGLFSNPRDPRVSLPSFAVMLFTMVVNIFVTFYERRKGKELSSDLLRSDALHTASDVFVTLSVMVGLFLIRIGWTWVDPITTMVVALVVLRVALKIVKQSSDVLCDHMVLDADEVIKLVSKIEGVKGCHMVRSRGRLDDIQLDLHVLVRDSTDVKSAHALSHRVEECIRQRFSGVSDIVVHIEPESSVAEGHI